MSDQKSAVSGQKSGASEAPLITFRPAQEEFFWAQNRRVAALWRRQFGKSRTMGAWGLKKMGEVAGDSVFIISAAIALGKENIRKEAQLWVEMIGALRAAAVADGKQLTSNGDNLNVDDVAELFESSKLETKLWHDQTTYSRSLVCAPNPDTVVGMTGHLIWDEFGRIPELQDCIEAAEPFMSSNPRFQQRLATTPPPEDDHYSWELLIDDNQTFPVNPRGNWYRSKMGILVHRCDVDDAYAGGIPMYHPETGEAISPDEARRLAFDKVGWDRNYRLGFIRGGTAALSLSSLSLAMVRGDGQGIGFATTEEVVA